MSEVSLEQAWWRVRVLRARLGGGGGRPHPRCPLLDYGKWTTLWGARAGSHMLGARVAGDGVAGAADLRLLRLYSRYRS